MKKVLIAYFSPGGTTEKMAQYIAEGVRFSGHEAVTRDIKDIKSPADLAGYDGYIFGSPTYSLALPGAMKLFLDTLEEAGLEGKPGGAFGPYRHDAGYSHDSHAPAVIFNIIQETGKMVPFELGAFVLQEETVGTGRGMEACQDYGRVFGERLDS